MEQIYRWIHIFLMFSNEIDINFFMKRFLNSRKTLIYNRFLFTNKKLFIYNLSKPTRKHYKTAILIELLFQISNFRISSDKSINLQIFSMENQGKAINRFKIKDGRWTKAQQKNFILGLQKYGKNWEKIQKKIKTRTLVQVRSHAQKFFLNMSKSDIQAYIGSDQESEGSESCEDLQIKIDDSGQLQQGSNSIKEQDLNPKANVDKDNQQEYLDQSSFKSLKIKQEQLTSNKQKLKHSPILISKPKNYKGKGIGESYFQKIYKIYKQCSKKGVTLLHI